jgi:hypothetical protein
MAVKRHVPPHQVLQSGDDPCTLAMLTLARVSCTDNDDAEAQRCFGDFKVVFRTQEELEASRIWALGVLLAFILRVVVIAAEVIIVVLFIVRVVVLPLRPDDEQGPAT